jgi:gamma-glutamylcyclotransferase (GGCT)/AIG2-like uncharacterized protein YtfP
MDLTALRIPVFVYGTLRTGQGNHRVLRPHAAAIHPASLPGHRLFGDGLPYVAPGDVHDAVIGELVSLSTDSYHQALRALDRLEGIEYGLYRREALQVRFRCGDHAWTTATAWVYLGGDRFDYSPDLVIPSGNWARVRHATAGTFVPATPDPA